MVKKLRVIIAIFCMTTFLTIFLNYNGVSESDNHNRQHVNYRGDFDRPAAAAAEQAAARTKRVKSLLDYRRVRGSGKDPEDLLLSSTTTAEGGGGDRAGQAGTAPDGGDRDGEADEEKILKEPLILPHRNNSIYCTSSVEHARETQTLKRASFTIVVNYIKGTREVKCDETITYTTHGDFRFLDNLVPLVERWDGPISIALYAPLSDLKPTIDAIIYLRECTSPLIKEWVTFHVFGDTRFFTDPMPFVRQIMSADSSVDTSLCAAKPDFGDDVPNERTKKKLLYPVNVARNVARQAAMTNYVLASDIELYPSLELIPMFMDMLNRNESKYLQRTNPRIFAIPVFEVKEDVELPDTKSDLVHLIKRREAFSFHRRICGRCHRIPKYFQWLRSTTIHDEQLDIFHGTKRLEKFKRWEPIFIGTNNEPLFDERLSWEGLRDKMTQNYILCVLDYDYLILDNAFLVHRPGIKVKKHPKKPDRATRKQNRIFRKISVELDKLYEKREGCEL